MRNIFKKQVSERSIFENEHKNKSRQKKISKIIGEHKKKIMASIASLIFYKASGISDFNYPINTHIIPDGIVSFWIKNISQDRLDRILYLPDSKHVELWLDQDVPTSHAELFQKTLKNLLQDPAYKALKINPNVVKVVYSDKLLSSEEAVTSRMSSHQVIYSIFGKNFNEKTIRHELLHALFQTEEAKNLPEFISEGTVYELTDNIGESLHLYNSDAQYVLSHGAGLFTQDGNLIDDELSITNMKDYVSEVFWEQVRKIDPKLLIKLLHISKNKEITFSEIPALLLENVAEEKKNALQKLLSQTTIFNVSQQDTIFVLPSISKAQNLVLSFQYNTPRNSMVKMWYTSSCKGKVISSWNTVPHLVSTGKELEFMKTQIQDELEFHIRMEMENGYKKELQFIYDGDKKNFHEKMQ